MSLQSGTRLGPYEIVAPIGAGGMGEVYKATDTRLNRTVAIKVLPPHFSEHFEMKQRFEREAQTIAGLNHPNICTLFDVGRQGDTDFLVMEYLEGETLAARIARGALPFGEAMKVAIAIADALDKAHGQGVTHRDLKPGNVMLTEKGAKLLDFGLAKLRESPQAAAAAQATMTSRIGMNTTAPGTILGTMQYMAPEQLEGKEADARTDIFAFGAVLYEMVTGRKAFEGKSQPHLIAAIVSAHPDPISKTQPTAPAGARLSREAMSGEGSGTAPADRDRSRVGAPVDRRRRHGGWRAGAACRSRTPRANRATRARGGLAACGGHGGARVHVATSAPRRGRKRGFLINVPDMPTLEAVSISPDGRWIAYSARDGASTAVFVRPIGLEVSQKLVGTEGAGRLFWSPDSRWIAFFAGGTLKKIEADGRTSAEHLRDAPICWAAPGTQTT